MVAICLAMAGAMLLSKSRQAPLQDALWIIPTLPIWAFLFRAYGLYRRPARRFDSTYLDDIPVIFHALLVGTLGIFFFYRAAPVPPLSLERTAVFGVLALTMIGAMRAAARILALRIRGPERVFVVAPIEDIRVMGRKMQNHPEYEMELVGAAVAEKGAPEDLGLEVSADIDDVESLISSGVIDRLLVQLDGEHMSQEKLVALMRTCYRSGVRFGAFPKEKTLLLPGVALDHIEGMGILSYEPPVLSRTSRLMKRGMDIVLSGALLVVFAPVMALIAVAVRVESRGGALFWQLRVGKNGNRFRLVKFRTMIDGAEAMTDGLMEQSTDAGWLALEDDPRRTRLGRFLRETSLDELPQLWNVLRGEMSLVGPRPLPERDDQSIESWGRHRLDLQPGLTGYWQVLGRNTIPFREMIEIDYAYVACWSLWLDLKLLFRTVPVVLLRRGTN
jgi:exopolysaccharide biosynthesis polyprenyl glycosylphosphotransferase